MYSLFARTCRVAEEQNVHATGISECAMVLWCSWLSRQSNTLNVSGTNPGEAIFASSFLRFKSGLYLSAFFLFMCSYLELESSGVSSVHHRFTGGVKGTSFFFAREHHKIP
jgi:hypothetical protein